MQLKVNVKQGIGMLLIYFLLLLNQTHVSEIYLKKFIIPITIITFAFLFVKSRILAKWSAICCSALLIFTILLRIFVGGVGIEAYFNLCVSIVVSAYAIAYNKDEFLNNYLKIVVFMAAISIFLWFFCMMFPDIYEKIAISYETQMTYRIYNSSTTYIERNYKAYGLFFYSLREFDNRNTGIFTEPGVYQMVLNSALFVLLILDKYLKNISKGRKRVYFSVLLIALLSTQSTTGYIGAFLIISFFILNTSTNYITERKVVFVGVLIIGFALLIDYHFRGEDSLVFVTLFKKLVTDSNTFSISADGSGLARWGTILISLRSMFVKPFGLGYDNFAQLLNTKETGYVAAAILSFGAIWGIIPLLFIIIWIFSPIVKSRLQWKDKILFVLLYFNTTLAQSDVFYPTLIIIPLCLYANRKWHVED